MRENRKRGHEKDNYVTEKKKTEMRHHKDRKKKHNMKRACEKRKKNPGENKNTVRKMKTWKKTNV